TGGLPTSFQPALCSASDRFRHPAGVYEHWEELQPLQRWVRLPISQEQVKRIVLIGLINNCYHHDQHDNFAFSKSGRTCRSTNSKHSSPSQILGDSTGPRNPLGSANPQ